MEKFKNLLIAEDDKEDYLLLVEALEQIYSGFSIRRAVNGLELMGYLKSFEKPEVIFLDLNMPVRNGIQSLKLIKAIPEFRNIPVIIYSTSNYRRDINEAFSNEAHYYIVKPTSLTALINALLDVFNRLVENGERPSKSNFVLGAEDVKNDTTERSA